MHLPGDRDWLGFDKNEGDHTTFDATVDAIVVRSAPDEHVALFQMDD
jgi:hypothetical protein